MESRGLLSIDRPSSARLHAEWLDYWRKQIDTDLLVFVDSDIEFRRGDWLLRLVAEVERTHCAMIYAEWLPGVDTQVDGRSARLAGRPAPWVLGVAPRKLTSVDVSFAELWSEPAGVSKGILVEDVGAAFHAEAVRRGANTVALPRRFRRLYHHYGGLSWIPSGGARGRKKARDDRVVARRLRLLRVAQDSPLSARRVLARTLLSPDVEDVRDGAFRVRAKLSRTIANAR
jgi:hypothetical protein